MIELSVIMGVYNTPHEYIEKAIESILNQSYREFEFVICNDGCTDDTFEYIQSKYHDERIVWIQNDRNRGLAYTLNNCLRHSKGKYIARMDADDFSRSDRFEKQINVLLNNSEIGVVNCNVKVFDDGGIYGERFAAENLSFHDFLFSNPIIHPAVMISREAIDQVGGYRDIKITVRNEDYDMFLRMIANNIKMYTIQEFLFDFREDKSTIKRRKYKYRINEYMVKYENFKKMNKLPRYYLYCIKPLIIGLIPYNVIRRYRNR